MQKDLLKNMVVSRNSLFLLLLFGFSEAAFSTSPIAFHIAAFADVSVSATCSSDHNGILCDTTCPSRTTFPSISATPFTPKDASCAGSSSHPSPADSKKGSVVFKNGSNCTSLNSTVQSSASGGFTFSVWIQLTSYQGKLFDIGNQFSVTLELNKLIVIGTEAIGKLGKSWTHLALRNNGYLDVFINGQRFINYSSPVSGVSTTYNLVIGPMKNLTGSEILEMADARWYQEGLTDREIESLAKGTFPIVDVESDCRCPESHPTLHKTTGVDKQRYLKCQNRQGGLTNRLNDDAHPGVYMLDGDNTTFWDSGPARTAAVTITLEKIVQWKKLVLFGLQPNKDMLVITLEGKNYTAQQNGNNAAVDFESQLSSMENRTVYESLLSDNLQISFGHSAQTYFTVAEVEIQVRCPCYGNDNNCTIGDSALDYSCTCTHLSHTSGQYCQTCRNEVYRKSEETICKYPCKCHSNGSIDNVCAKVGGQCSCKSNVDSSTRECDRCKFNSGNITSDKTTGCTECLCNPSGITECTDDLICRCKANVETDSGRCQQCIPYHYGISDENGCSPCDCDQVGTIDEKKSICNITTGQCSCKRDVTGRRCDTCKDEYFDLAIKQIHGCEPCLCNIVGRKNNRCDKETGQCVCRQPVTDNRVCKPMNLHLEPDYGPVAGGTKITVTGELLGDDTVIVRVTLSELLDAVEKNDTAIIMRTKRHATTEEVPLEIAWSKGADVHQDDSNLKFTFKKNPTVTVPNADVKTFASGGCQVDIFGENLDNVPQPELFIYTPSQNFSTPCTSNDWSQVTCRTPNVTDAISEGNVSYGIGLDNIHDYNLFSSSQTAIHVEPDPDVTTNEMIEFRNTFDDTVTIKGTGLNKACRDSDVRILIDNVTCTLLRRSDSEITCDPGESFPGTSREALIMLYIGDMAVEVGKVKFISFWKTSEFYIIIGCVCGGILVVVIIIIAVCLCRRRRRKDINGSLKRSSAIELTTEKSLSQGALDTVPNRRANAYVTMDPVPTSNPVALVSPMTTKPIDHSKAFIKRLPTNVAKAVKTSVVDKSQIELGRHCTQKGGLIRIINGQFGTTSSSPFAGTNLTIKTLIDQYDDKGPLPSWLTDGLLECTRLRDCYNENVLPLLGISIDEKHVYVIYPEMANRNLKEYLSSTSRAFNQQKRLNICVQVAEGMNFLDSEHIVHKDIATRNCWVESNELIKIGDSSFSWDLYPDEYLLQNDRYQPVRWMAPESLKQPGFYNSKTDVWSYGVFMWEVFTDGHLPYHDIEDDTQIKQYVCEAGYRLGKPHECSDIIFKVIEICHGENSQSRPNFFIILNHLTEIVAGRNPTISYVNQQNFTADDGEVDYMNYGQVAGLTHSRPPLK